MMDKKSIALVVLGLLLVLCLGFIGYNLYQQHEREVYSSGASMGVDLLIQQVEEKGFVEYTKTDGNKSALLSPEYVRALIEQLQRADVNAKGSN